MVTPISISIASKVNNQKNNAGKPICCAVFEKDQEIFRTESNITPIYSKHFKTDFDFKQSRLLTFKMISENNVIGSADIYLAEILTKPEFETNLLLGNLVSGSIAVTGKETKDSNNAGTLGIHLSCKNLDKKDLIGTSDPYLIIYDGLTDAKLLTTEIIYNNLFPTFEPITLPINCCEKLRIECWDWNKREAHELIGSTEVTFDMSEFENDVVLENFECNLINIASKKDNKKAGVIVFSDFKIKKNYSFVDYIQKGTHLALSVGIDFTDGNRNQDLKDSLHYIGDTSSAYERAIATIDKALYHYKDKSILLLGFGGKINNKTRNDFPVSLADTEPRVIGIDGVQKAYRKALSKVTLSGPREFGTFIRSSLNILQNSTNQFHVLTVLLCGDIEENLYITDILEHVNKRPVSIVVVGLGTGPFDTIKKLASTSTILQFVESSQLESDSIWLSKIQDRFMAYMALEKVIPGNLK